MSEITDDNPSAESAFVNASDEQVNSEVTVAPSESDIEEDLARLSEESGQQCYLEAFQDLLVKNVLESGDDIDIGVVTFNELSFEDVGDDSIAFRLTVPLSQGDIEVELFADYIVATKGRVGVTMGFTSTVTPFDEALALELTETVVDRIPADA